MAQFSPALAAAPFLSHFPFSSCLAFERRVMVWILRSSKAYSSYWLSATSAWLVWCAYSLRTFASYC